MTDSDSDTSACWRIQLLQRIIIIIIIVIIARRVMAPTAHVGRVVVDRVR